MRKISFSMTDEEYLIIKRSAEKEGLTPSQFVKRVTIIAARNDDFGEGVAAYGIEMED